MARDLNTTSNNQELQLESLIENIREDYFLVKKRNLFYFFGGAFAFMVTSYFVTYQNIFTRVTNNVANQITTQVAEEVKNKVGEETIKLIEDDKTKIQQIKTEATKSLTNIQKIEGQALTVSPNLEILTNAEKFIEIVNAFQTTDKESFVFFGKPLDNNNTKRIWFEKTPNKEGDLVVDTIVLGGRIKLKGDTGDDVFLIRHYPEGDEFDKEPLTRISYPRIKLATGKTKGTKIIIDGNVEIRNGTIKIKGQEVQVKPKASSN